MMLVWCFVVAPLYVALSVPLTTKLHTRSSVEALAHDFVRGHENQLYTTGLSTVTENKDDADTTDEAPTFETWPSVSDKAIGNEEEKHGAVLHDVDNTTEPVRTHDSLGSDDVSNTTSCGDGMCHCNGDSADCSRRPGGLPYVPKLSRRIHVLNISYDGITKIPGDYFTNVTGLRLLTLSGNNLQFISPDAFKVFDTLYGLYIDFNVQPLKYDTLLPVVNTTTIEKLSITQSGLGPLPPGFFSNLLNLQELVLYDNSITSLSSSEFQGLRNLSKLGLADNRISRFTMDGALYNLDTLNLNTNGLYEFPETCNGSTNDSLFPNLTHLLLRKNRISYVPGTVCLPKVKVLVLEDNDVTVFAPNTFGSSKFPSLVELFLDFMDVKKSNNPFNFSAYAFNNTSLERITLSYNFIEFADKEHVDVAVFANCPKLQNLQLNHNYFKNIWEDRFLQLFGHLTLQYLYMEQCELKNITRKMLTPFRNLHYLHMSRNELSILDDGTFDDLVKLKELYLEDNHISVVSPGLFSAKLRNTLQKLDLSGNPFDCSCSVLWFQTWLMSKHSLFYPSWSKYTCFNKPGLHLEDFVMNQQACLFSHLAYVLIVVLGSLAIITYTSILLAYRYRWHFRLIMYQAFRGRGDARRRHLEMGDFDYDVFVSFDSEDYQWVRTHLMPQLEGCKGLKLCIHERDFIAGKYIVDNIADCVDKSKKVMMVFSTNFALSHWCQFELAMCLRHVMDHDDDLIVVCLGDLSARDLTSSMMAVLKTTTYIQWEENSQDAAEAFWGRLDIALQEIVPCSLGSTPDNSLP